MGVSQFRMYASIDADAPVLTGQPGSLLNLLDACLVTGYGSKPPLGWTKPFPNSNNVGCFGNVRPELPNHSYYFSINDNAPSSAREARVTGYAALTGVASGVGAFGPLVWRKSTDVSATARTWFLFGDSRTFYLFVQPGDSGGSIVYMGYGFGDFYSYTNDPYRAALWGRASDSATAITSGTVMGGGLTDAAASITTSLSTVLIAARYSGIIIRPSTSQAGDLTKTSGVSLAGIMTYPTPDDLSIYVSPIWIAETAPGIVRGHLRGLWQVCHPAVIFGFGDTFQGTAELAGREWAIVVPVRSNGSAADAAVAIEISNTVDTNDL